MATKGRDGAYYVSQLTGFPFPKGAANIYRVDPRTGRTTIYASGLTNVTDLAFDGRTLYAVQISTEGLLTESTGSVVKIRPGGSSHTTVAGDLIAPYGIAISKGNAYVTTSAVAKDAGEVRPDPALVGAGQWIMVALVIVEATDRQAHRHVSQVVVREGGFEPPRP